MTKGRIAGEVRIVGAGLLGASIGLVLARNGVDVSLVDVSPTAVTLAVEYGAGRPASPTDNPTLIIVCVPPDVAADTIARELEAFPNAVVTDVTSVKEAISESLIARGADMARYVGSHPMAGRERGGAIAARADIFTGRAWILCADESTDPAAIRLVEDLATDCGATPVHLAAAEHDAAVALVSHVPQIVSSAVAASLIGASDDAVALAGGGLRDVTRVASSDPALWVQILSANAGPVADVLRGIRSNLDGVISALESGASAGAIATLMARGNSGVSRIPGKHGRSHRFAQILVIIDDRPGQLAALLTEIGSLGVNMEDLRLEHSPGAQVGFAEISVLPEAEERLVADLEARGWRIASEEA
ncbi:prephenate dehydrogenase [Microbacteriaceae bacterium MWH-Ta3]|nr:prephenate dehydrogenase [Microbacteriaceae bacterium MWH-Ta3]